jgi:hypothetical protein
MYTTARDDSLSHLNLYRQFYWSHLLPVQGQLKCPGLGAPTRLRLVAERKGGSVSWPARSHTRYRCAEFWMDYSRFRQKYVF